MKQCFGEGLEMFLEAGYRYEIIIIHYGFHHGFAKYCYENEDNYSEYKKSYDELVLLCKKHADKVILMTGTSYVLRDKTDEIDMSLEPEIQMRNQISCELAEKYDIPLFDLHHLMTSEGKRYCYVDLVHFEDSAYIFIAYCVSKIVFDKEIQYITDNLKYEVRNEKFLFNSAFDLALYGCGISGVRIYFQLKYFLPEAQIVSWYETTIRETTPRFFYDIPVLEINNLKNRDVIVIITSEKYADEMEKELVDNGIYNFVHIA